MLMFSCRHCECPAFTLPAELTADSEATCARCYASLGTWGALKQRLEEDLLRCDQPKAGAPAGPRGRGDAEALRAH